MNNNTKDAECDKYAEYVATLASHAHRPWATYGIIAVNVLIFVLMCVTDAGSVMNPKTETLLKFGADFSPLTIDHGEWWRIMTSAFVHIGVLHIFCNLFTLYGFGELVERIFGRGLFLLIYLGSILTGGLLSLAMHSEPIVSGGASGAIFGVFGALAAYLIRRRSEIPAPVFKMLAEDLKSFALGAVALILIAWVNNWAHLGGALGGFLFGLAAAPPVCSPRRSRIICRNFIVLLFLIPLVAVPAWFGVKNAKASPFYAFVAQYGELEEQLFQSRRELADGRDAEEITDEEYLKFLEERRLPIVQAMARALEELPRERLHSFEKEGLERLEWVVAKRLEIIQLEIQGIREDDAALRKKALSALRELEATLNSSRESSGASSGDSPEVPAE